MPGGLCQGDDIAACGAKYSNASARPTPTDRLLGYLAPASSLAGSGVTSV
jgi:hypothetical protein